MKVDSGPLNPSRIWSGIKDSPSSVCKVFKSPRKAWEDGEVKGFSILGFLTIFSILAVVALTSLPTASAWGTLDFHGWNAFSDELPSDKGIGTYNGAGLSTVTQQASGTTGSWLYHEQSWNNQWGDSGDTALNSYDWMHKGDGGGSAFTATDGCYYTFNFPWNPNDGDTPYVVLETSEVPENIDSVSDESSVYPGEWMTVDITLSGPPCAEEHVYVRYTSDGWSSYDFVEASGSGTSYSANIPGQSAGTTVDYYVMTSTVSATNSNLNNYPNFMTLRYNNNTGNNYSYTVSSTESGVYLSGTIYDPTNWGLNPDNTKMGNENMPSGYVKKVVQPTKGDNWKIFEDTLGNNWGNGYWVPGPSGHLDKVHNIGRDGSNAKFDGANWSEFAGYMIVTSKEYPDESGSENFGFMTTSSYPVAVTSVSDDAGFNGRVGEGDPVTVTVSLSGSKCPEENVYVRYTTDGWSSSNFVEATGGGTTYTATIPGQTGGTNVEYYALTSTVSASQLDSNPDLFTITADTNGGSNYSYSVTYRDWTGVSPVRTNFYTVSENEWIWNDNAGDMRTNGTDPDSNYDLTEFRVTGNSENIYFLTQLNDITDNTSPYLTIALDKTKDSAGNVWLPDSSDTRVDNTSDSSNARWENCIIVNTSKTVVENTAWVEHATGSSYVNTTKDLVEVRVPLSDLGVTWPSDLRFTVATAEHGGSGGIANISGYSDFLDVVTKTSGNTWNDVSDGEINYYFDAAFDASGNAYDNTTPWGTHSWTQQKWDNGSTGTPPEVLDITTDPSYAKYALGENENVAGSIVKLENTSGGETETVKATSFEKTQSNDNIGYTLQQDTSQEDIWGRDDSNPRTGTYEITAQDVDEETRIIFDSVDVSSYDNVWVNLWIDATAGGMETSDYIRGYVKIDGGSWTQFFDRDGQNLSSYTEETYDVGDSANTVEIKVAFDDSAGSEYYYLDDVSITGKSTGGTANAYKPGAYVESSVLDIGSENTWSGVSWNATNTANTDENVYIRTSDNDNTPYIGPVENIASHVVISEIQIDSIDGTGGTDDDWIEIYNPTASSIDLDSASYRLERDYHGGAGDNPDIVMRFGDAGDGTYPGGTTIPAYGYYLALDNDSSNSTLRSKADALIFDVTLGDDDVVYLGTGSISSPTDSDIVDFVGYGNPTDNIAEDNSPAPQPPDGGSIERKSDSTGVTEGEGNGYDTDNNANDFISQSSPNPENSSDPAEEPPGTGEGTWNSWQQVTNGESISIENQYLQYRVELSTTDNTETPEFDNITFGYSSSVLESTDSGGSVKNTFDPGDNVYVTGTDFGADKNYDVYVVANSSWSGGESLVGENVCSIKTVTTDPDGIFGPSLAWENAESGYYDVIADNGDAVYNSFVDGLDDMDVGGAGLFVVPEPASILAFLACLGALFVLLMKRRRAT